MEKINLEFTHQDTIARIILSNGKGNVLDNQLMTELLNTLEDFKSKKDLKLVTFEGWNENFSYGASVAEHTRELAGNMLKTFHQIFYRLIDLGIPTAAKITGQCLGGGMELALVCNFLFADKSAVFGQPEITLGVFAPPASIMLPLKIGYAKAEELLITGRTITANEAHNMGLLSHLYESKAHIDQAFSRWVSDYILPKSASSLRYAVKAARVTFNKLIYERLSDLEHMYLDQLMETKDANEGINSFLEKRKPQWENC